MTFSTNTKNVDRLMVCTQLEVKESANPGKYLGMPMRIGGLENTDRLSGA